MFQISRIAMVGRCANVQTLWLQWTMSMMCRMMYSGHSCDVRQPMCLQECSRRQQNRRQHCIAGHDVHHQLYV